MHIRYLLLVAIAGWAGLIATTALASPPENADEFRAAVLKKSPIGSPIARAKANAEAMGLTCVWVERQSFEGLAGKADFYHCSLVSGILVPVYWQAALIPKNKKLDNVLVSVGLLGPL
jgi:hypothetical protein